MKLFRVADTETALQLRQLIQLNGECVRLHWSRTIRDVPAEVKSALETVEAYIEKTVYSYCDADDLIGELSPEDEAALFRLIRKEPGLKATLGAGVVLAGAEAAEAHRLLTAASAPRLVSDAVQSGGNIVLF